MSKLFTVGISIIIAGLLFIFSYLNRDLESLEDTKNKGAVIALIEGGKGFKALDIFNGKELGEVKLDFEVQDMVPTPGGVALFLTDKDSPRIHVYSSLENEGFKKLTTIELPELPVDSTIDYLSFSPTGERVYIISSNEIFEYSHQKFILDFLSKKDLGSGNSRLIPNKQGSRLYRGTNGGIDIIFARGLQYIDSIDISNNLDMSKVNWDTNRDGALLWGADNNNVYWLSTLDNSFGSTKLDLNSNSLTVGDNFTWVLSTNGDYLYKFNNSKRNSSPKKIKLESVAHNIEIAESDNIFVFNDKGYSFYVNDRVMATVELDNKIVSGAYSRVQEGGGFACF